MNDIPPHMLNQFRLFMQMQQSYDTPASSNSTLSPHAPGSANPTNTTVPLLPAQSDALNSIVSNATTAAGSASRNPSITPYQSARQPSYTVPSASSQNRLIPSAPISTTGSGSLYLNGVTGLPANIPTPPQGMGPGTSLGTSFLGFQQRTGQANQARLAAAAQNLPRRPALQNRRHHLGTLSAPSSSQALSTTQSRTNRRVRGPSGQRPHAHRQHPELSDVVYSSSGQGEPTHSHIRVKVLPDCGVCFSKLLLADLQLKSRNLMLGICGKTFSVQISQRLLQRVT